jgi:hypothetical protein
VSTRLSASQKKPSTANTTNDRALLHQYVLPTNSAVPQITCRSHADHMTSMFAETRRVTCDSVIETALRAGRRALCNGDHVSCCRHYPGGGRTTGPDKNLRCFRPRQRRTRLISIADTRRSRPTPGWVRRPAEFLIAHRSYQGAGDPRSRGESAGRSGRPAAGPAVGLLRPEPVS